MTNEELSEKLADIYQAIGALMERWDELGFTVQDLDALVEAQRRLEAA